MGADKLILLSRAIKRKFVDVAMDLGKPRDGYAKFIDLEESEMRLPVRLHFQGRYNQINKIDFKAVAHLGLSGVAQITEEIFGNSNLAKIYRVDWCADLDNVAVEDVALYCRISSSQNCRFIRSRSGTTFYPFISQSKTLLIYDRLRRMRSQRNPDANIYGERERLTRVEVQFRGRGLPFRRFKDLRRYAEIDLLPNLTLWNVGIKRQNLGSMQTLAAEALLKRIDEFGIQAAAKFHTSQEWAYICRTLLDLRPNDNRLNLTELMRRSALDWLEDRIRFPRGKR